MFTRKHNKEEIKLWRIIFDQRETIELMSHKLDAGERVRNRIINMHQPHGANNSVCINCSQRYPCQTINALKP
jgi:formate hydrogenlyase subunit 6/NADH:ubiquinone oxidoreductase subunit I